jgi:CheY-like chemotaxis protein
MLFAGIGPGDESEYQSAILIAEDDENDICLIRRAFHQAGFENPLRIVRNGEEAIAYLNGEAPFSDRSQNPWPALVLLDIKMPRKNGFEVLKWVREQTEFSNLPVVMVTSSQESTDINQSYALGANSYLVKPASFPRLVEMMGRLKEYCSFTHQNVTLGWI